MTRISPALGIGILSGLAFFAHAMVNNSHAWPLIWPLIGGAAAVARSERAGAHSFAAKTWLAARTGLVAGGLFFVATLAALTALSHAAGSRAAGTWGLDGPVSLTPALVTGVAVAALLGVLLASIAGAATSPMVKPKG